MQHLSLSIGYLKQRVADHKFLQPLIDQLEGASENRALLTIQLLDEVLAALRPLDHMVAEVSRARYALGLLRGQLDNDRRDALFRSAAETYATLPLAVRLGDEI